MRILDRSIVLAAVSAAALATATGSAQAGGFAVREQSATAQGLSFAGTASGSGGLSSMFWNPATITMAPGWNSEFSASLIVPESKINPVPPTPTIGLGPSGDIAQDAVVPSSYSSYQINDRIWVGLSSTSPFGLVTKPNDVWAGQVYSRSSKVFTLNVNPIIGIKITDWLSIGGGPVGQYIDVRLKRAVPSSANPLTALAPTAPNGILDGDDIGFGYTLGATITPFAGTSIGVGFRSAIDHELEGTLSTPAAVLPIRAKLTLPEQVTVGLSQQITPELKIHLGYEWQNWSRLKNVAVVGPFGPIAASTLAFNYRDGHFYSVGAEYAFSPRLTLRVGAAYEQSPITEQIRSTRLPDNDRYWASIGASYKVNEKLSVDFSYSHIFVKNTNIRIVPGHQDYAGVPFLADVDSKVDIVSVGLKYRFDTPAVAAVPVAPIVRKY